MLKIYDDTQEVALHIISQKEGEFISKDEHRPPEKQKKSAQQYIQKSIAFGTYTHAFLQKLKEEKPFNWIRMMQGIFILENKYGIETINLACKRALSFNALSYTSVQNICKNKLYDKPAESLAVKAVNGFAHELKNYDKLSNN